MTDAWQPGKTYVPGSIVRPTTQTAPGLPALVNPDFESGSTGWTLSAGWAVATDGAHPYQGSGYGNYTGGAGYAQITNTAEATVTPGQQITVTGMCNTYANSGGGNSAYATVIVQWYDAAHNPIRADLGSRAIGGNPPNYYKQCSLTATAPANAAYARAGFAAGNGSAWVDSLSWSSNYVGPPAGLVYKATQAAPGKSAATEPVWPGNTTTPVTDNQVTWQGVIATQLVWQAIAVNTSGATEPAWPTQPGGVVHDGTIDWIAKTPAIADTNCPHSKIVAIASSKVYAADGDIIRYCATVNPLDWSSKNDAGYIPFGLSSYGSNDVAAMNLYRSNLVAFNSEGFQMWQVDEDPANTALLDALPVASTQNQAASPVSNDLLFLSAEGVRSMGIAAASTNLQGSDVGMPIDPLIKVAMADAVANNSLVISTYVPSLGQYWLSFSNYPPGPPVLALSGTLPDGAVGTPYSASLTASGGTPPYVNWTITAGTLPPGLTINSATGVISGTPT